MNLYRYLIFFLIVVTGQCKNNPAAGTARTENFPVELINFTPYKNNPVFRAGTGNVWDSMIRERGYILFEDTIYKMWYTGYTSDDENEPKKLGYATSKDGIRWERHPGNPLFTEKWVEDVFVFRHDGKYYMYAEGAKDVAHHLVSEDGINWKELGDLVIMKSNGDTIPGPYGTPVVWVEKGKWYLFYERNDEAVWLAISNDKRVWKNVKDDPVLKTGPEKFDLGAVAANQVFKYGSKYYMHYHASADPMWASKPSPWSSNIAVSDDLLHWRKYSGNPIIDGDHSSSMGMFVGDSYRLYSMHEEVWMYEGHPK